MKLQTQSATVVVVLLIIFTGVFGATIMGQTGMDWYATLTLPTWTPPGSFIGAVWTILFTLIGISIVLWASGPHDALFRRTLGVWIINGVFNISWTGIFFGLHLFLPAVIDALLLTLTTYWLIYLLWRKHRTSAYLIIPYAAWVTFATYLAFSVWLLNR